MDINEIKDKVRTFLIEEMEIEPDKIADEARLKEASMFGAPGALGNDCDLEFSRHWSQRRQWHPTLVRLPGKSHGRRSLVGYSPWGRKESDTTE